MGLRPCGCQHVFACVFILILDSSLHFSPSLFCTDEPHLPKTITFSHTCITPQCVQDMLNPLPQCCECSCSQELYFSWILLLYFTVTLTCWLGSNPQPLSGRPLFISLTEWDDTLTPQEGWFSVWTLQPQHWEPECNPGFSACADTLLHTGNKRNPRSASVHSSSSLMPLASAFYITLKHHVVREGAVERVRVKGSHILTWFTSVSGRGESFLWHRNMMIQQSEKVCANYTFLWGEKVNPEEWIFDCISWITAATNDYLVIKYSIDYWNE